MYIYIYVYICYNIKLHGFTCALFVECLVVAGCISFKALVWVPIHQPQQGRKSDAAVRSRHYLSRFVYSNPQNAGSMVWFKDV